MHARTYSGGNSARVLGVQLKQTGGKLLVYQTLYATGLGTGRAGGTFTDTP